MLILHRELIDTLWNVNESCRAGKSCKNNELIDTLWNVNQKKGSNYSRTDIRINRYIMECKSCKNAIPLSIRSIELIDTLWNVNP